MVFIRFKTWSIIKLASSSCNQVISKSVNSIVLDPGSATQEEDGTQLRHSLLYTQIRSLGRLTKGNQCAGVAILDEGALVMHDIEATLIELAACTVNLKFQKDQYFLLLFLYRSKDVHSEPKIPKRSIFLVPFLYFSKDLCDK